MFWIFKLAFPIPMKWLQQFVFWKHQIIKKTTKISNYSKLFKAPKFLLKFECFFVFKFSKFVENISIFDTFDNL